MPNKRDDFNKTVIQTLSKRAAYICSNPDCRALTICPSENDSNKPMYVGEASHITSAAPNGPRYDESITSEQRSSIANAIFLCKICARMIDTNNGVDFSTELLKSWKKEHEEWIRNNLNKRVSFFETPIIDGEHCAKGRGEVIGIDVKSPVIFKPGTKAIAEGEGTVIATRIECKR